MRLQKRSIPGVTLLLILVIAVGFAGCTGYQPSGGTSTPQQTSVPSGNTVAIKNFAFSPPTLTVAKGTTVTWVNQDAPEHQVVNDATGTSAEGAIFRSNLLPSGASYSFIFTAPGTYPYHCLIHPSMKGTIIVT